MNEIVFVFMKIELTLYINYFIFKSYNVL